ncbi:MAG: N-acetyl-gamma-glutamyl-phosphate reductase [Candidatus Omnitrophica bacterium]|jgi:N-acetyl-gamma-glutamyl-phosphate reductase|nr:N-acetyl-gamma-glutamyl-phosphate reductase [Candidatus Omnitrophota bacterium]MDD5518081.1 N-acetyl-gamma-glutamyl-phosphate reductase [Candidatus Omnitrophota bacterium]
MVKVGIVGVSGYTGEELIRILLRHPGVKLNGLFSSSAYAKPIAEIFPDLAGKLDLVCLKPAIKDIVGKCDVVFLALPHTTSMDLVPQLIKAGKRVIDLSADYRLKDFKAYEKFYQYKHKDKANLKSSVYGLPELYRAQIKKAGIVANPGCYPTAAILALAPLAAIGAADFNSVIIDAKSGVSGAGRKKTEVFFSSPDKEDFKAYKVGVHQHTPEINQALAILAGKKVKVTFVPHLLPVKIGILETIYIKKNQKAKIKKLKLVDLYKKFYKHEPFVRIKAEGEFPALKDVVGTNFCDIGIKDCVDSVIVISAIDNLIKGASGQAVQNLNIMYRFPETAGLL